jgi:multiple sugar transport system substrate-binding protein
MTELEFSIMRRGDDPVGDLQPLLDRFEAETRVKVRVTVLRWRDGWAEMVKTALYGHGPDVSEIGTTWIGNLIAMNALRPFELPELYKLGGEKVFLPASWQSGRVPDDAIVYAVPWLADTRLIYYHRSALEQAGLEAGTAFDSPAQLSSTLQRLQDSGRAPWVMCTATPRRLLQEAASWVWSAGGDFVSADGKRILFDQPEALAGLKAYFELGRYLGPEARRLDGGQADDLFVQQQVASMLNMPIAYLLQRRLYPDVVKEWGVAPVMGTPFVGGSNLVIWKHSRQEQNALKLLRWLTTPEAQNTYNMFSGLLPVRVESLTAPAFANDPDLARIAQGLRQGRSFPAIRLWGLIESKLADALGQIWTESVDSPAPEIDALLDKHLALAARSLNKTLSA